MKQKLMLSLLVTKNLWGAILALSYLLYATNSFAVCYYITTPSGDEYSSIFPPYDLSFPRTEPLSPAEIKRRERIGYLTITMDRTGCGKNPFPETVLNPPTNKPNVVLPERTEQPPAPRRPTATPPSPAPSPATDARYRPTTPPPPTAAKLDSPQGITLNHMMDTINSMDAALSRKDLQTYQLYLAAQLSINQTSAEGEASSPKSLSRADYISDLQQQLQRVSSYNISHQDMEIEVDAETNTATVKASVKLNGEYKNALPLNTTYQETAVFVWDNSLKQAVLQELTMQPEIAGEATVPATETAVMAGDDNFCQDVKGIEQAECEVLLQFHASTGGTQWEAVSGWLQTKEPCLWGGVACEAGHVIELRLIRKNLSGRLPDLSGLSKLQVLDIEKNKISGEVPDLSALSELRVLDLSRNSLLGAVPNISALSQLEVFEGHKNGFLGALPDFSKLTQLAELDLSSNQLSGSLPDFSQLKQLRKLNLSNNRLSGELQGLSGLSNMLELRLHKNQLSGSLADIGSLKQIRKLYLSDNQFSGELPDLSRLRWLETLIVSNNQLSGPLPASLNQLNDVEWLQMNDNQFSGRIPDLSNLKRLKALYLSNNQLCGEVPQWLLSSNLKRNTSNFKLANNRLVASSPEMQQFLQQKEPGWDVTQQAVGNCP